MIRTISAGLIAGLVALALALGLSPSASASTSAPAAVAAASGSAPSAAAPSFIVGAGAVPNVSVDNKWWGIQFKFSKRETEAIAKGGQACGSAVAIPQLRLSCAVASVAAKAARKQGKCLSFNQRWVGPGNLWYYSC